MVSNEENKVPYNGNGSNTRFEITFPVLKDGNGDAYGIAVALLDSNNKQIDLDRDVDYTIDGIEVVLGTAPSADEQLTIYRKNEMTQGSDLVNNDPIDTEALEAMFDKLTMISQEISERTGRMVQQPITDTAVSLVFPSVGERANAFLAFDNAGNIIAYTGAYPENWNVNFPFPINRFVQHEGVFYKSKAANNKGHEPVGGTDDAYWEKVNLYGTAWVPKLIYPAGFVLFHNGLPYKAKQQNCDSEPPAVGVTSEDWEELQLGGTGGLPNYIDNRAAKFTADTAQGFSIVDETASPIDVNGCLKFVVPTGSNVGKGFYQDVVISEIHKNSKLQLQFYIDEHDVDADIEELSVKVIDLDSDPDYVLFDAPIIDYAIKNPVTGIYLFSAFINTNNNSNLRIYVYQNAAVAAESEFMISGLSLGAPFYYTVPKNGLKAGEMYYSTEPPIAGKNTAGDLCFDGSSSHSLADYRDVSEKESELINANYIDSDGTDFTVRALRHDPGWIAIPASFMADQSISITHGLNVEDIADLRFKYLVSTDGAGTGAIELKYFAFDRISAATSDDYGVQFKYLSKDSVQLKTGQSGAMVLNALGNPGLAYTHYRIIVERKDAPQPGTYAYMRSHNQQTVDLFSKQTNRSDFDEIKYKATPPDGNGIGPDGMLVFDSSFTHQFSKYPEINAAKTVLETANLIHDNGDGTFHMMDLAYETGFTQIADIRNLQQNIPHNLNVDFKKLNFKLLVDTTNTGAAGTIFEIKDTSFSPASPTLTNYGFQFKNGADNDNITWQVGGSGITYISAGGALTAINNQNWWYNVIVSRNDAPQDGMYAYLRTKSLSAIVMAENLNQPGYNGTVYRPTVKDISSSDQTTGLDQYLSTGSSPKLDGWRIKATWSGGNGLYAHIFDSTLNFKNEYFDLPPGDNSTTFTCCGYGDGGLTLEKDEANSRWVVVTEGCFDKCVLASGKNRIYRFTDKRMINEYSKFPVTAAPTVYTYAIPFKDDLIVYDAKSSFSVAYNVVLTSPTATGANVYVRNVEAGTNVTTDNPYISISGEQRD